MGSISDMRHDLAEFLPEMSRWDKFVSWLDYWWLSRRWETPVSLWWHYKVLRSPPCPPLVKDRIARHFGFAEGVPACTDGPVCAEHGWEIVEWPAP